MSRLRTIILCAAVTAAPYALTIPFADSVGAQETPPPTTPCVGCGPSGSTVPGANLAYAWTDHHCLPDGRSAFSVTYGLGKNSGIASIVFYATYSGGSQPDRVLDTLTAGEERTVYPLVIVGPGETVNLTVVARVKGSGDFFKFGNGTKSQTFMLSCPCEQPATTTTPPTSTPAFPPPTVTGSSVPGTSTAPPPQSTVPGTPTTTPFELPATGVSAAEVVTVAGLLLVAGAGSILLARKRTED